MEDKPPKPIPTITGHANALALLTTIEGFDFDDNITETGLPSIPPAPIGAAGLDRVIAVVNRMIEAHDKAGALLFRDALADFFIPLSPITLTFDPKVIYDQHADRFVVVTLEQVDADPPSNPDPGNISRILLAVSRTSTPATPTAADWVFHDIGAKTLIDGVEHWADYPGFAVDEEAVYITNNMFSFGAENYGGVRLWIVGKGLGTGGFYDGGVDGVTVHDPYAAVGLPDFSFTTQPAHMFGAGPAGVGTFLVAYSGLTNGDPGGTEFVQVMRVDDPLGTPAFIHQFVNVGDIEDVCGVFGFPDLPGAPQSGTAIEIHVNNRISLHAVWRNDALWTTTTINPNSGPDAGQTTAHWFKVDTSNLASLAVDDQGDVGGEDIAAGTFTFFPSIAVDGNGNMAIGFAASAATIFPGAFYTGRLASDPAGTVQLSQTLRAGLDYYVRTFRSPGVGRNRWGDYSGISVDPSDDATFWVFNEYAITRGTVSGTEDGHWGTAFGSFSMDTAAPAPPVLVSP